MEKFNLIVSSAGFNSINNYVSKENHELFSKISKGKKVMILANAAPKESSNYIARENVKSNFLNAGAIEVDIVDVDDTNVDVITKYDIIYGLGGNVTHLVELCKNKKFKENIISFLKTGVYIGESAGSIILCDDAKYYYDIKKGVKEKYNVNLDTYEGLGLIDFKVYPHYNKQNQEMKDKIDLYEKNNSIEIVKLNDGDVICKKV